MAAPKKRRPTTHTLAAHPEPAPTAETPSRAFWRDEPRAWRTAFEGFWRNGEAFGLLILLAFLSRFYALDNASLWMDEIAILQEAGAESYSLIAYRVHAAHLKPIAMVLNLVGESPWSVRAWSALLGALAVPAAYLAGYALAGFRHALLFGLLILSNCFLLMYGQDANYYGGVTFYTCMQLIGFVLFFRGAPYSGMLVVLVFGLLSFKSHPATAICAGTMVAVMGSTSPLLPRTRGTVYALRPRDWAGRPAVPLLLLIPLSLLVPAVWRQVAAGYTTFSDLVELGGSTLTNVRFGWPLFRDHFRDLTVNFFRPLPYQTWLGWLPLICFAGGAYVAVNRWKRSGNEAALALLILAIALPVASYVMIFSIRMNRNFNLRYFIYLLPPFLAVLPFAMVRLQERLELARIPKMRRVVWMLAYCALLSPFLLQSLYSFSYLLADKSNYMEGTRALAGVYDGEQLLVPSRNDILAARHHLEQQSLPTHAPDFTYLNLLDFSDFHSGPLPFALNQQDTFYVLSGWRHVEAPRLYEFLERSMKRRYQGLAKWGPEEDFWLLRWTKPDVVVYPDLAARLDSSQVNVGAMLFAGAGEWQTNLPQSPVVSTGATRWEKIPQAARDRVYIPLLADVVRRDYWQTANFPDRAPLREVEIGGRRYLRNERDASYDFLFFQPPHERRTLVVHLPRRDEADPLLGKNPGIPPGLWLGVAVDSKHAGCWKIDSGPVEDVALPIALDLAPGNHRITLSFFVPRLQYTPHMPWMFSHVEWVKDFAEDPVAPAVERVSPGWTAIPLAGERGKNPGRDWRIGGPFEVRVDEELTAPAGDPALRVTMPAVAKGSLQLLAPPMPVEPGTLANFSFFVRMQGLEAHELTPVHVFVTRDGRQIPGALHANGPNLRGSTPGKGWMRREVTVPVPENAAFLLPGLVSFPIKNPRVPQEEATVWIGSFSSPGIGDVSFDDPLLPPSYFGFAELPEAP